MPRWLEERQAAGVRSHHPKNSNLYCVALHATLTKMMLKRTVAEPSVSHPGARVREEIIPKGMSVTKAAALLGVGRPALSNLLNGNAALTAEMATR